MNVMSESPTSPVIGETLRRYEEIPLVNTEIADELFGTAWEDDEEMQEIRLELWQGVNADLPRDLDAVLVLLQEAASEEKGRKEAHRVAGYCGNAGMERMGVVLRDLQHQRMPGEAVPAVLDHLHEWARASLSALQTRFPSLSG